MLIVTTRFKSQDNLEQKDSMKMNTNSFLQQFPILFKNVLIFRGSQVKFFISSAFVFKPIYNAFSKKRKSDHTFLHALHFKKIKNYL